MTSNSSCPDVQVLSRLAVGRMPPGEVERLAQHCEQCERCIQALHTLHAQDTLMEAMAAQATALDRPPDATADGLIRRLEGLGPPGLACEDAATAALTPSDPPGPTPPPHSACAGPSPETTQELYDFLAPPEGPGELGRLGPYRVLRVLGAGGMGVVFQAEDPQLERQVALKVMRPALAASAPARQRFLREAKAAAAVKHDHVLTIYQVGEDRGVPFLAMELLEGMPLDRWLQGGRRPTVAQVLRIGRETALGLAAAHERGLVHRDIKPANLWLEAAHGGRVKILDFGLARPVAGTAHLTQSGTLVGTPSYMAPEQARGQTADHRADLFSLGCVLYRLTTGEVPFPGEDSLAVLTSLALDRPRPPGERNPEVPAALADLIERLLAKKPADRPGSAREVAEALQAIERGLGACGPDRTAATAAHAAPRAAVLITAGALRPRRRPLVAVAAGLLVAATVLAGVVVIIRDRHGKEVARLTVPEGGRVEVQDEARDGDAGKPRPPWLKDGKVQYLSDIDEFDVKVSDGPPGRRRFAKNGDLGYGERDQRYSFARITVNGKSYPHGLSMCPESNTYAGVKYRLEKAARTFMTAVALNDSACAPGHQPGDGKIPTRLTFQVLGDGRLLWSSKPVDVARVVQECEVDVAGVDVLELRVDCPGSGVNADAVWLEPRVLLK